MNPEEKNAPIIKELENKCNDLRGLRDFFKSKYNNRESALVVTKLQEAEHWLKEQIDNLK